VSLLVLDEGRVKVADRIGFDPRNLDAFARLLVTTPEQLASYDHRIDKQPLYWDEVVANGGTGIHDANRVSVISRVGTTSGASVIRQTYRSFEYRRGNAQIIYLSGILGAGKANVVKRLGYFDENNGVFFETNGTSFHVVRRSRASGSVVDMVVSQNDFNGDKVDGTGSSGLTLDLTKQNLFYIDFSWLGTNIIRFCVVIDGQLIILHQMNNANVISEPWSQTGQLPIRSEIFNSATSASQTDLVLTCCAVFTSGSNKKESRIRGVTSGATAISVNTTDSVIAGIRLKPTLRNVSLQAVEYDFLPASGNSFLYYQVILRPTLTGATWVDAFDLAQSLSNTPTFTGGTVIETGHLNLATAGRLPFGSIVKNDLFLGYSINDTPDTLILVARTTGGTGSFYFNGFFSEVY
jgi:hypothetical protein